MNDDNTTADTTTADTTTADTTTADSTADSTATAPSDTADDSGDDNGGGSAQDQLAAMIIESLDATGYDFDEDCISDKTHQLSDEDAEAIVAAGPTGDPDVSDEADAIGGTLADCVTVPGSTIPD